MPAIVGRAVWEKTTKGRAGMRWDNVVDKTYARIQGETEKRYCLDREVWRVQDRSKRNNTKRERLAR